MNSSKEHTKNKQYIAIDIAKDSLAVKGDFFNGSFDYNAQGLQQLLLKLQMRLGMLVLVKQ